MSDTRNLIKAKDRVIIFESFEKQKAVTVKPGDTYQCRFGAFPHSSFIGKPFGTKILATNKQGHVFLLKFTPELWSIALATRTQILYEADISAIMMWLDVKAGSVVLEAGTGSGALSHAFARTIGSKGHLYTFEFHEQRSKLAKIDFDLNKIGNIVTVEHRDVCTQGLPDSLPLADAAFFDLPDASAVVVTAQSKLKNNGIFCAFCPCIEQVQRVCESLRENGFMNVTTIETVLRKYDVKSYNRDQITFSDFPSNPTKTDETTEDVEDENENEEAVAEGGEGVVHAEMGENDDEAATTTGDDGTRKRKAEAQESEAPSSKVAKEEVSEEKSTISATAPKTEPTRFPLRMYRQVTKPFPDMRGHTGYLTFAWKAPVPLSSS